MNGIMTDQNSCLTQCEDPQNVFTPEDMDGEQKLLGKVVDEFVQGEVEPLIKEMEAREEGVMEGLIRKSAQLGIQGLDVPEKFDGMELDPTSALIVTEKLALGGPFGVTSLDHTTFATLPILYFGTSDQKEAYLKALATAKKIGAFALTEPDSGSDALNAATSATLSEDGKHYILSGEKQFISNAAYAGVFVLFAKIDGEQFTAFILDGDSPGLTLGEEEDKMGIKGTSTRSVILENVEIPIENVLLEPGKGHVVAFNTLNMGRLRMAALCLGTAKNALKLSIYYAKNRFQFERKIAEFGMVRNKLAQMSVLIFAAESMLYRTAGLMEEGFEALSLDGEEASDQVAALLTEHAMECSMNKVFSSEMLNFVVHEAVQIHGGYGYIKDYDIERYYRDARINLIYGGTNEINRLLIARRFLANIKNKRISLADALEDLEFPTTEGSEPASAHDLMENARKAALIAISAAHAYAEGDLEAHQEIMALISDLLIEIFTMESVYLRSKKSEQKEEGDRSEIPSCMARIYLIEGSMRVNRWAKMILGHVLMGDERSERLKVLHGLSAPNTEDVVGLYQEVAQAMIQTGRYFIS